MMRFCKNEKGNTMVEAAMILPVCFIMIILLYLVAVYLCQRANLQANLQTALIYFKNPLSDNYLDVKNKGEDIMSGLGSGTVLGNGSTYQKDGDRYLTPYRHFLFMENANGDFAVEKKSKSDFENFFRSICGYMFFDNGENVQIVEFSEDNYIIYKRVKATVKQEFKQPLNLGLIRFAGASSAARTWDIVVQGEVVVHNPDNLIRDVDFAIDLVETTTFANKIAEYLGKAKEIYDKFYNYFH